MGDPHAPLGELTPVTATDRARELSLVAAQAAADKLATDVTLIDVSDQLVITDVFVIASGSTVRQVSAIVDAVQEAMRAHGEKPLRREGEREGLWVLLDYADVVVHVQQDAERVLYALERLWSDCPTIPFVDRDKVAHEAGLETERSGPSA